MKRICLIAAMIYGFRLTAHAQKVPIFSPKAVFEQTHAVNAVSLQGQLEKNVTKICAAYTADAILLPPDVAEPIQGAQAIRAYYTAGLRAGTTLKINTEKVRFDVLDPTHATEVGKYTIVYRAANTTKKTVLKGMMLIGWEKNAAGAWHIKWDMWH